MILMSSCPEKVGVTVVLFHIAIYFSGNLVLPAALDPGGSSDGVS